MDKTYAVIGLGYVGLGLAIALSKISQVIAYDINQKRINELQRHCDRNKEITQSELEKAPILFTSNLQDIKAANFYIISVPTPAHCYEYPDLDPLIAATIQIGTVIKKGDIIVYESSVYPGTTDEICIPLLESHSGLTCGEDFNVGYSPERVNPGDSVHTLKNITKIISAQNEKTLHAIQQTYQAICDKTYPVSSMQIAEAIKILENTQRDVNIALMNEFSKIMHAMKLEVHEILEGAKTKWSFIPFKPGLVGGHCISIDPHYLGFRARQFGVYPELIRTARKINDDMTQFIIHEMLKTMIKHNLETNNMTVGVFGISYKENSFDLRNSLSLKLIKELHEHGIQVRVHDPFKHEEFEPEKHHVTLEHFDEIHDLSAVLLLVGHDYYKKIGFNELLNKCGPKKMIMDIPNLFIEEFQAYQPLIYWSL